jgi:hypothetical protein
LIWLLSGVVRDQVSRGAALKIWEALRPRRSPPSAL